MNLVRKGKSVKFGRSSRYCKCFKHKSGTWTSGVSIDLRDKGHDANNTIPCS
ncbi:uncharacterized protein METZ01_LOCUS88604 [marine metagenome]|uniref:Uncharacterized protein n=1 Tax=marine metagenome TaxID=408172 RepID=A0A381V627_9ZZZZ